MEYSIGKPGRIIAVKLDEGEKLYDSIESLARGIIEVYIYYLKSCCL